MWRNEGLAALDWNWGESYEITEALGVWRAIRRDSFKTLVATSPEDLRELILVDFTDAPVPLRIRRARPVVPESVGGRTPIG
jgi:hypothetical protein